MDGIDYGISGSRPEGSAKNIVCEVIINCTMENVQKEDPQRLLDLNCNIIRLGLDPIRHLLERMENPQLKYPAVLIGGTNGKGSTAAILSCILKESGYKVGLYTSPHLTSICERIRINGSLISEERMQDCFGMIQSSLEEPLTYFEVLTASAYLYFCQEKVDVAVLEVGMGGRLDATNVVTPLVSVISNVHLEHQEYLGRHLRDIAAEKAGIIKENSVCVAAVTQKAVLDLLSETCRQKEATLYRLGKDIRVRVKGDGTFSYQGIAIKLDDLKCTLSGAHQIKNAALALAAAEVVTTKGIRVNRQAMLSGVACASWDGRLEILQNTPTVLVDGAHNPAAANVLCQALRNRNADDHRLLIFGALGDKNYRLMLKKLLPFFDHVIFTKPKTERAGDVADLIRAARHYDRSAEAIEDSCEALQRALCLTGKNDMICITGSLYLVGEIKKRYAENLHAACKHGISPAVAS